MSLDHNINFNNIQQRFNRMMEDLPPKLGTVMVNFSKARFREQSWCDVTASPWAKRKANTKNNRGRAILIGSGRLRRSIRIISTTRNKVTIGTDVPYAEAHNDGVDKTVTVNAFARRKSQIQKIYSIKTKKGRFAKVTVGSTMVKSHQRHMNLPRRRFLGESHELTNQLTRFISIEINNVFK
jgi:phage gpG-like protein